MKHVDSCHCDLCEAEHIYVAELQNTLHTMITSFLNTYNRLPAPEAMEEAAKTLTEHCAYSALVGVVQRLVDDGILPADAFPQPQVAEQQEVYDKKLN